MGNDEGVSSENGEEVFVHLDAANRAIDFLRKRNIHLPFAPICNLGEEGIEFQEEFLVNNVSNHMDEVDSTTASIKWIPTLQVS